MTRPKRNRKYSDKNMRKSGYGGVQKTKTAGRWRELQCHGHPVLRHPLVRRNATVVHLGDAKVNLRPCVNDDDCTHNNQPRTRARTQNLDDKLNKRGPPGLCRETTWRWRGDATGTPGRSGSFPPSSTPERRSMDAACVCIWSILTVHLKLC